MKGRLFKPGKNFKARPTTDFAKENLFNILSNRIDFEETKVLDLFVGTGSISFEFASRGCCSDTCVEIDHVHYAFISSVIQQLHLENVVHLLRYDVLKFIPRCTEKYDLIFADPPYQLKGLKDIPDLVLKHELLNPGGLDRAALAIISAASSSAAASAASLLARSSDSSSATRSAADGSAVVASSASAGA